MQRLRRFLRLPAAERLILIKSALLLETISIAMRLLPFRVLRRLVDGAGKVPIGLQRIDRIPVERVAWAVETASRYTSGEKTCLSKALAAQVLITRRGQPALLHIGVVRSAEGAFQAHAWVESEGRVIVGGHELERYVPLTTLKGSMT